MRCLQALEKGNLSFNYAWVTEMRSSFWDVLAPAAAPIPRTCHFFRTCLYSVYGKVTCRCTMPGDTQRAFTPKHAKVLLIWLDKQDSYTLSIPANSTQDQLSTGLV